MLCILVAYYIFLNSGIEKCHKTKHQKQLNHSYLEFENWELRICLWKTVNNITLEHNGFGIRDSPDCFAVFVSLLQMADVIDEVVVGVTAGLAISWFSANLTQQSRRINFIVLIIPNTDAVKFCSNNKKLKFPAISFKMIDTWLNLSPLSHCLYPKSLPF